jgi:nucleoside 2-deoxyribosyltransferase
MKAYLANGLFSLSDRLFNDYLADSLRFELPVLDLYVPQENAEINDKHSYADSITIANGDLDKLVESDFVVAVIDGVEIDSGVSCEIGYAIAKGIPVYALYTDVRQLGTDNMEKISALVSDGTENQFMYRNLFVLGLIKQNGAVFSDIDSLINAILEVHYA